jgi:hypothetical protein
MHSVQHGLVAKQVEQPGGIGEFAPGLAQTGESVAIRICGQSLVKQIPLYGEGTVEPPIGSNHFLDHPEFHAVPWRELIQILPQE